MTGSTLGQVNDPVPDKINPSGAILKLHNWRVIPASSTQKPLARINLLREAPDQSERLFVNDLRGAFWVLDKEQTIKYTDLSEVFTDFIAAPGKGTGFGAFAFHPKFEMNGLFYTTHTESTASASADFVPIEDNGITMQWVLTEWKTNDPAANEFDGTRRELLRLDFPGNFHGMQEIAFNPTVSEGNEDYGLLYLCIGDGASSLNFLEENLQSKKSYLSAILRIDPQGNNSQNGQYGIPSNNPFTSDNDPAVLKEIYAYGFRNPHRISWDMGSDHKLLVGEIGEKNIEEVNWVEAGQNYGWGNREGTFLYDRNTGREFVYTLPDNDTDFNYSYPIAQYDHDEGLAIVGGYVYRGDELPALNGHYIFGDIVSGKLFHFAEADIEKGKQVAIAQVATVGEDDSGASLLGLVQSNRADLRFGRDSKGEIYILTKADGAIRRMTERYVTAVSSIAITDEQSWFSPNPGNGRLNFTDRVTKFHSQLIPSQITVYDQSGRKVFRKKTLSIGASLDLTHLPKGYYIIQYKREEKLFSQKIAIF